MIVNTNSIVQHLTQIKNGIMIMSMSITPAKKDYSWNPTSTYICENSWYLQSIVHDSVIVCDEILNVTNSISTNVTNTIARSKMSTDSINPDDKKIRYKIMPTCVY